MNCGEVQKSLSNLLDKSLDVEHAQEIEDHLTACPLCREEMARLAECQRLVSGLPAVEPPVGFTNRVMAEVREAANPPSLWERLFLPLRIKIPLQATAVVVIAVLAAYIYQKEPRERESGVTFQPESSFRKQEETHNLAPSAAQGPPAPSKTKQVAEETKVRIQEFKDSAQLKEPQSPSKTEEQNKGIAGSQPNAPATSRAQNQVRSPATLGPTPLREKSSAATEATSPRPEQSSPSGGLQAKGALAPVPQPEKENVSKDAAATGKSLLSPEARERSAASSLDALRSGTVVGVALPSDHELVIRLKEPVRDDKTTGDRLAPGAQAERRSLTSQEEAKNLEQARERAIQTGQAQTVWITIARSQYDLFKKELADMGSIEEEAFTPDSKNDVVAKSSDQPRIKITILPPLASGNPVPSQPSSR
jgi:Predicted integral membrane protein (DUF2275)/Putative zinc-finger